MAYEQIAVAGIQISQVMGNRQANISTEIEVLWRTMTNGMCAVLVCAARKTISLLEYEDEYDGLLKNLNGLENK